MSRFPAGFFTSRNMGNALVLLAITTVAQNKSFKTMFFHCFDKFIFSLIYYRLAHSKLSQSEFSACLKASQ
jgi:hypothetical protein